MFRDSPSEYLEIVGRGDGLDFIWTIDFAEEEDPGLWEVVLTSDSSLPGFLTTPYRN